MVFAFPVGSTRFLFLLVAASNLAPIMSNIPPKTAAKPRYTVITTAKNLLNAGATFVSTTFLILVKLLFSQLEKLSSLFLALSVPDTAVEVPPIRTPTKSSRGLRSSLKISFIFFQDSVKFLTVSPDLEPQLFCVFVRRATAAVIVPIMATAGPPT